MVQLVFENEKTKAVIIAGYGMGNVPIQDKVFMKLVKNACDANKIVVIKTQCYEGTVNDLYEAGRELTKLGCILGLDMTTECLFAKLSYLIGKHWKTGNKSEIDLIKLRMC